MEMVTQESATVAEETAAAGHNNMQNEIINLEEAVHITDSLVKQKND